jgi:NADH-quinone oxidoreductase subunit N
VTATDLLALSPYIAVYAAATLVMLGVAVRRQATVSWILGVAGLVLAIGLLLAAAPLAPRRVTPLLVVDRYALFYGALVFGAALVIVLLSRPYLACRPCLADEFYLLVLLATAGAGVMAASRHFAAFYLGLEVLSTSLYALVGYRCGSRRSIEAATKYLVLAAAAAAFLLFGAALVYAEVGSLAFARLVAAGPQLCHSSVGLAGLALIVVGLGFKLSVVPFHMWTSDVYEGAPAPVAAYLATVAKAAVFALLLRYLRAVPGASYPSLELALSLLAVASMFVGNLLALRQQNLKRLLAFSSVAHLGYLLTVYQAANTAAVEAITVYLVTYVVASLGAFGVVTILSSQSGDREIDSLADYRGLFTRRPVLATVLAVTLLSLAGVPLTVGFLGKFYAITVGVAAQLWWQMGALVINSVIGLVYYLRVVNTMVEPAVDPAAAELAPTCHCRLATAVVACLALVVVVLGVYPAPLVEVVRGLLPPAP